MDPVTHALSGALLVRAVEPVLPKLKALPVRPRLLAGAIAAIFPDVDVVLRLIDTLTYLNWHQGPTHSLLMLPLWAFFLAHLFSRVIHCRYSWQLFFIPACLGIAIHIAGDLITSYGLMLLAPFSTEKFSLSFAFVIDVWLTGIIVLALVISQILFQKNYLAGLGLVCLIIYVVFLGSLHERAEHIGLKYAREMNLAQAEVSVLPQPLSPFNWKIVVMEGDTYHILLTNLGGGSRVALPAMGVLSKMAAVYQPADSADWKQLKRFGDFPVDMILVREVWHHSAMAEFRQFALFPQLDRIDYSAQGVCVWFYDLRFKFPLLPPSFRYGGCRQEGEASWNLQREKGTFWID